MHANKYANKVGIIKQGSTYWQTPIATSFSQREREGLWLTIIYADPLSCILGCNEQSNHTPRCSWKVSAAGLPWLEHFRVQYY